MPESSWSIPELQHKQQKPREGTRPRAYSHHIMTVFNVLDHGRSRVQDPLVALCGHILYTLLFYAAERMVLDRDVQGVKRIVRGIF